LNEVVPICPNFIKVVKIHPNDFDFIQIWIKFCIIHPDISERTKILMELFYIAHLWTRLFEVAHNWMKLLQIGKIRFDWWTSPKCFQLIQIFLFSPKFDWSFSHFPRFNWGCWTLPKCSYFTQMFLILPKTLLKLFNWPIFDEGCWNCHMIPVHSRAVFILPSRAKKNGKIVWDYFAVLVMIFPLIWLLFCLNWKIDTTSLACECSCILGPNNGQFFSVGDATASPCRTLMELTVKQHLRGLTFFHRKVLSEFSLNPILVMFLHEPRVRFALAQVSCD